MRKFQCNAYPGATLVEYCFIGALILAVSIGAVFAIGNGLAGTMKNLKADLQKNTGAAAWANLPKGPNATGPGQNGINGVVPNPGPGQQQVCYQSGWCVNIPVINPQTASTTGSMGGEWTQDLASVLDQIKAQLEASGGDPGVIALITQLANQGHSLANDQAVVDQFIAGLGVKSEAELVAIAGQYGGMDSTRAKQAQMNQMLQELNSYIASHPNALPPEMQNLINTEVGTMNNIMTMYNQDQDIPQTTQQNLAKGMVQDEANTWAVLNYWNQLKTMSAPGGQPGSAITQHSANTVCGNGGNTNQCIQ